MANDIDKTSPHYKGEFGSIYEVNQKFPSGGVEGDYVAIDGWAHYWNADRGTWCVNAQRDSYWDELITGIIEKFKLIKGATYMGVAGLDTVPQAFTGAKMYYFATVAGTYKNFGGLVVPQGINVLYSENGKNWVNSTLLEVTQELGVSTKKVVSQKALNDALNLKANQSSVNEALAKKANKDLMDIELGKKFDKTSVAHDSGDSEELVMSQKAVSDKLSDLSSTILPVTSKELLGIVREVYVEGIEDMDSVYTITVTKNTDKLHIYISKGSEAISSFYATSTQSEYNVNKKGIIELSPMGDNGKKAYVFADFSKKELGFSKKSNLDIAVASYLDFSPSIKSMLNQKQITGITEGQLAINKAIEKKNNNLLYGKTLLAIGDSIVAQNYWQKQVGLVLGMKVRTHAKGGIGIVQMVDGDGSGDAPEDYDPDTFGVSKIYRLNTEDVKDASVIILMGFYNERSGLTNPGAVTDIYPDNNTIAGRLNYAIKRVYEELSKANNNTCRLVICSAHRYGKYAYIDKDSYNDGDELLKVTKMVAEHQSIPCIDLMHNGGINKYNWNLFQKKSTPFNPDYIAVDGVNNGTNKPFDNIQDFPLASENKGKYVTLKGTSDRSYQSDGETWVLKNTAAPWNADQLHLSADGGKLLGNYIAAQLLSL